MCRKKRNATPKDGVFKCEIVLNFLRVPDASQPGATFKPPRSLKMNMHECRVSVNSGDTLRDAVFEQEYLTVIRELFVFGGTV